MDHGNYKIPPLEKYRPRHVTWEGELTERSNLQPILGLWQLHTLQVSTFYKDIEELEKGKEESQKLYKDSEQKSLRVRDGCHTLVYQKGKQVENDKHLCCEKIAGTTHLSNPEKRKVK